MSTTWIRDRVVAVAEAQAEETGEDASEIIWQLSKELGHMAQVSGSTPPSEETLMDRIRATYKTDAPIASIDPIDPIDPMIGYLKPEQIVTPETRKIMADATDSQFDSVSRPAHYAEGRRHEPKDVIRDWGLNHNLGAAVKYLSRAGRKNDIIEDLEKAITYIGFEVVALKEERDGSQD